jgi:hypothetical protein
LVPRVDLNYRVHHYEYHNSYLFVNVCIWTPPQMQALRFYGDWYDFWMIAPVQWILPNVRFRWIADIQNVQLEYHYQF